MYISSTLSQQTASGSRTRCSYVVLHHHDERVLIPLQADVCGHYETLIRFAKEEWDLEGDELVLETKELDVCPGVCVKLRRECFAAGILNEIGNVFISRRINADFSSSKTVKGLTTTQTQSSKSVDINQPDYVVVCSKSVSDSDETESTPAGFQTADEGALSSPPRDALAGSKNLKDSSASQTSQPSHQEDGLQEKKNEQEDVFNSSQTPSSSQNTDCADVEAGRFVVCIHDGIEENSAAFRVAPDQTVLRVLKGACKHFKLDFTQSVLFKEVNTEGRIQRIECEHGATMRSLGVQEFQQFAVGPITFMISR